MVQYYGLIFYMENNIGDMLVVRHGIWEKHRSMWYGMLAVRYGKNAVCGMVCWRYGTIVRCCGFILWLNVHGGMICSNLQ